MQRVSGASVPFEGFWRISLVLASLGLLDSVYLTWIKLANATAACSNIGDCDVVNSSRFSQVAGIPIAALGAAAYLGILLLLIAERRLPRLNESARFGVFGIALAGTLYSAYLTYVEIAILQAICPFCVVSAVLITGLLGLASLRLREGEA